MWIRTYVLCTLLALVAGLAHAQDAPELRCISLDENDDVTLYWVQPSDTGADFNRYLVYYSSGNQSNFSILAQVTDYNQTSVLVNGSFAGAGRFYIVQVYNGFADTSLAVDTASPIVVGISSNGKRVSLGWNHTGLVSSDSIYRVYKRDEAGNWNLLRKLDYPMTAVRDTIGSCTAEVAYRVETKGKGGCISRSNLATKTVIDEEPPIRVDLSCASVDTATGHVNLEWFASPSPDTYGYLIFYFEDFNRTDTSFSDSILNATYSDFGINALIRPETLSVAPFDSCFDSTNQWYNQAAGGLRFVTLHIDTLDFDRCEETLALKWSIPNDPNLALGVRHLGGFGVYRRTNHGPSERIATLSSMDSLFVDEGVKAGSHYSYVVTCIDSVTGKEALSNKLEIDLNKIDAPDFLYIKSVKNNHASGLNEIHILADTLSETKTYGLYRSLHADKDYALVERLSDPRSSFEIIDLSGKAGQTSYHYQVKAFDRCGEVIASSQRVQSVHIKGTKNLRDLLNRLEWNAYLGFDSLSDGVQGYDLLRRTGDDADELIASYPQPVDHTDDIAYLNDLGGAVCYYVEVLEEGPNSYGMADTARSNLWCLEFPSIAFVPNAFSPDNDGVNDVFLPYVNFIDPASYRLVVFDRMGRMVFETDDPDKGWDGADMPMGTYAFHLSFENVHGEPVEQTGKIHLIR